MIILLFHLLSLIPYGCALFTITSVKNLICALDADLMSVLCVLGVCVHMNKLLVCCVCEVVLCVCMCL